MAFHCSVSALKASNILPMCSSLATSSCMVFRTVVLLFEVGPLLGGHLFSPGLLPGAESLVHLVIARIFLVGFDRQSEWGLLRAPEPGRSLLLKRGALGG